MLVTTVLSLIVSGPNTMPGDVAVGRWVQGFDSAFFDWVAWFGNWVGETRVAVSAAVAVVVYAMLRRRWHDVLFVSLVIVFRVAALELKGVIESPRPTEDQLRLAEELSSFGFPSGHALSATVLAGTLIVLLRRNAASPARRVGIVACLILPVFTCFARVYDGVHWPSDVLGGVLWGSIVVLLAAEISRRVPAWGQ